MTFAKDGYALTADEGEAIWFLGTLMTVKAGGDQTNGALTVIEWVAPPGFAPPPHIHHLDDEAFYVLEGELTVTCREKTWVAGPGAFVMLPRGIPHSFVVSRPGPARGLQITAPAQFERFAAELGEPARERVLPPPMEPDIEKILALSTKYHFELADLPAGQERNQP